MRVWERGSGETFACGTGACATVVACVLNGLTDDKVTVKLLGGDLFIEYNSCLLYTSYQEGLKNLAYDLLYGDNYASNGRNPYKPTNIQLGLHEVKVSSVTPMYNSDGEAVSYTHLII